MISWLAGESAVAVASTNWKTCCPKMMAPQRKPRKPKPPASTKIPINLFWTWGYIKNFCLKKGGLILRLFRFKRTDVNSIGVLLDCCWSSLSSWPGKRPKLLHSYTVSKNINSPAQSFVLRSIQIAHPEPLLCIWLRLGDGGLLWSIRVKSLIGFTSRGRFWFWRLESWVFGVRTQPICPGFTLANSAEPFY